MVVDGQRIELIRNWEDECKYMHESASLHLSNSNGNTQPLGKLHLFQGTAPNAAAAAHTIHTSIKAAKRARSLQRDYMLFAGGPVWGLEWAPDGVERRLPHNRHRIGLLAVAAHPVTHRHNANVDKVHGPALIQLYDFIDQQPPVLLYAVLHHGGVSYDMQWQPVGDTSTMHTTPSPPTAATGSSASSHHTHTHAHTHDRSTHDQLGLLAVATGSGEAVVLAMPTPAAVYQQAIQQGLLTTTTPHDASPSPSTPLIIKPIYIGRLNMDLSTHNTTTHNTTTHTTNNTTNEQNTNENTMYTTKGEVFLPSSLAWHPRAPHDRLVIGCWNGAIVVVQFVQEAALHERLQVLLCVQQSPFAIRVVMWAPLSRSDGTPLDRHEVDNVIAAGGNDGNLQVWDLRSPHIPKMNLSVTRHSMLSAAWPPGLPWPVVACEDSCLRGITINDKGVLSHKHVKNVVPESCAVWGVDALCPPNHLPVVAYVGEDGSASLLVAGEEWESRRRDIKCLGGVYKIRPPGADTIDRALRESAEDTHGKKESKPSSKKRKASLSSLSEDEEDEDLDEVEEGGPRSTNQNQKTQPGTLPMALDDDSLGLLLYTNKAPMPTHVMHRMYPEEVALYRVRLKSFGDQEVVAVYGGAAGVVRCQGVS